MARLIIEIEEIRKPVPDDPERNVYGYATQIRMEMAEGEEQHLTLVGPIIGLAITEALKFFYGHVAQGSLLFAEDSDDPGFDLGKKAEEIAAQVSENPFSNLPDYDSVPK